MKTLVKWIFGFFLLINMGCKNSDALKSGQGFLDVNGGKIWYEVIGEGNNTPILLLHGGPGYPSYYLNPLKALAHNRSVIMFDQLGCGRSDKLVDTTLMTIDAYVAQTKKLIEHLKIKELIIYGHSWGTTLGTEYYDKFPDGIKALILGSPCIDLTMWQQDADTLMSILPDTIESTLRLSMENIVPDSSKLKDAIDYYNNQYYTRKHPLSKDILKADSAWYRSPIVYKYMWGMDEYFVNGTLHGYDGKDILRKIIVPVLYITGEYDSARPSTVKKYQEITLNSKLEIIKGAGHQTQNDNPEAEIKIIESFLSELE